MVIKDSNVAAATIGAAVASVGLLISTVTEWFKSRSESARSTRAWRRETMFTAAYDYVEACWALSGAAQEARERRRSGESLDALQPALDRCREIHGGLTASLTALRMLAPSEVVVAAEGAHDSHHHLLNAAFGEESPGTSRRTSIETWEQLRAAAAEDRKTLIVAVRAVFGIDKDALEFGALEQSSWVVPADRLPVPEVPYPQP